MAAGSDSSGIAVAATATDNVTAAAGTTTGVPACRRICRCYTACCPALCCRCCCNCYRCVLPFPPPAAATGHKPAVLLLLLSQVLQLLSQVLLLLSRSAVFLQRGYRMLQESHVLQLLHEAQGACRTVVCMGLCWTCAESVLGVSCRCPCADLLLSEAS